MANPIPPPPPGFQIVQSGGVPPPPPGFQLVEAQPAEPAQKLPDTNVTAGEPSIGRQLLDTTARATGNVAKGIGSIIDLPIDALNAGVQHFGGPAGYFQTIHGLTDKALQAGGVPEASTPTERVIGRVEQGLGGLVGGMGIGGALRSTASPVAQSVGTVLQSQPGAQAAAATAGSAAGGIAHESGASPRTELLVSLAGGFTPATMEATAQGAARAGSRLLGSVDQETSRLAGLAQQNKIPLKASQISESKVAKLLDSATGQVPFSGGQKIQGASQAAFNRAVGKTIGLDAEKITPEAFNGAVKRISGEFDRLTANNSIPITPDLGNKLQAVASDAAAYYGPEAASMVNATIDRLVSQSQGGVIPGRVYQSIDSKLGQAARAGGERSVVLGDLQEVLRDAMEANLRPEDAAAWAQARQQWKDMRTIEPLVAKSTTGDISPAQLIGRTMSNKAGKTSMARGTRGDLGDLARIGQRFLKEPIADSGTARRTAVIDSLKGLGTVAGSALGTGAAINPVGGLIAGASAVGLSRAVQNILKNPRLVEAMLNSPSTNQQLKLALQKAIGASANPATQSVMTQGR